MSKKVAVRDRAMLPVVPVQMSSAEALQVVEQKKPTTGPGSMMAFMQRDSETFIENEHLRTELEVYRSGHLTRKLDSSSVVHSKWANRHEQSFADKEFLKLKAEIDGAGGNVQAIKVRPLAGQEGKYEVVFGHRRHQACLELGLPVLAMIEDLSEQDLFVQMDRENRDRKDLRPYEQGLMYAKALDGGLFPSAKKMAASLGVDLTGIGRAMAIARLPEIVLNAFQSPLDIQLKWGGEIKDALESNPDFVMDKAAELAQLNPKLDGKSVLAALLNTGGTLAVTPDSLISDFKGKHGESAYLVIDKQKKSVTLKCKGLNDAQIKKVDVFIKELLKS